jgi:uncharacterized protein YhhL (DUF1145 family)
MEFSSFVKKNERVLVQSELALAIPLITCVWQFLFLRLITSGFSHRELREHALAFMKIGSRYPDLLTLLWHIWASCCLSTHLRKISPENALERVQVIFSFGVSNRRNLVSQKTLYSCTYCLI